MRLWKGAQRLASSHSIRTIHITCRGRTITRDELFSYSNGRFLINERQSCDRRYIRFDVDQLCAVVARAGNSESPVHLIEKLEGGYSRALLMRKENGNEVIAKLPFSVAGPPKYTTASEVAVLQYVREHTEIPVPKVLAWSSDPSNPVGAEYIIMEKAPGVQLFEHWGDVKERDKLKLIKQVAVWESQLAASRFPAYGSLYLRKSMGKNDRYENLNRDLDPSEEFCIGPTCECEWWDARELATPDLNRGPWLDLSSFSVAIAERELARIKNKLSAGKSGTPHEAVDERIAALEKAKAVFSKLDSDTTLDQLSRPTLWHTDLHMGNIYVSNEDPTKIISIIDWQSILVSPLCLQARFPEFLAPDEDYVLGFEMPKLPEDYDQMDADDKELADLKVNDAKMSKAYEMATGSKTKIAWKALTMPTYLRELFVHCGEVSKEGAIPLRACLIEIFRAWDELGFTGECPFTYDEEELQKHDEEFRAYRNRHAVQGLARELLDTDSEGWISPQLDFEKKQQQNQELLQAVMARSEDYGMSPEEVQRIWPYQDK